MSAAAPKRRRAPSKARVGSIGDNRLGGWHGYRAAKAALNMLVRNFAIELRRSHPLAVVVGLHPGTVDTPIVSEVAEKYPDSPQALGEPVEIRRIDGRQQRRTARERLDPGELRGARIVLQNDPAEARRPE